MKGTRLTYFHIFCLPSTSFVSQNKLQKTNLDQKESLGKVNSSSQIPRQSAINHQNGARQEQKGKEETERRKECYLRTNIENVIQLCNSFPRLLFYGVAQETE